MSNKLFFTFFIVSCTNFLFAQTKKVFIEVKEKNPTEKSSYIFYNKNINLSWSDFKAKPDLQNPYQAITNAGMQMYFSSTETKDSIKVLISTYCYFDKNKSWHKTPVNDTMLLHELYHFKIMAYYFYLFTNELKAIKAKTTNEVADKAYALFRTYESQAKEMQTLYDNETDHSVIYTVQKQWEEKIANWLKEFE